MREVEHMLRQTRSLNDAADLNSTFFLDEFPDCVEE